MKLFKTNKVVLQLQNNVDAFLNGLTANKLDAQRNAFVNIHGKIVAVFDQSRMDDDSFYMCLESSSLDRLMDHVDRYVKLSGVSIDRLNHNVYFDLDGECDFQSGDMVFLQKEGQLIVTSRELEATVSEEEFQLFRLNHNIPLQGIDFDDDFLLNIGMDEYVSFDKGCFLGQEPISKVYNRAKPTWQLVVKSKTECSDEEYQKMTSKIFDLEVLTERGFVFVRNK